MVASSTTMRSMVVMICCAAMMMMVVVPHATTARPLKARTAPLSETHAPVTLISTTTEVQAQVDEAQLLADALPEEHDVVAEAEEVARRSRMRIASLAGAFAGVTGSSSPVTPFGYNSIAFTSSVYKQCVYNENWQLGWDVNNAWVQAATGTLLTSFYRSSEHSLLHNLEFSQSCSVQGAEVLTSNQVEPNWWYSMDNAGWSECPANTYLQALYRGSCDNLHCLESAKCNSLNSAVSSGYGTCKEVDILIPFDSAGWVSCPADMFIVALYRSGSDYIYGIETMKCCKPNLYTIGWKFGNWSTCTGSQTRSVLCYNSAGAIIADSYCPATTRPASSQNCVVPLGPADIWTWKSGNWSACNQTLCGLQYKYRTVACYNGLGALGADTRCNTTGTKPVAVQNCGLDSGDCPVNKVIVGEWGACSATCNNGTQSRLVYWANTGRKVIGDATYPDVQTCNYGACIVYVYSWNYTDFSSCSKTCGTGTQTRLATCRDQFGVEATTPSLCGDRDATEIVCKDSECIYDAVISEWSECSATCGAGVKTRTAICSYPLCYNVSLIMECGLVDCPIYSWNISDWSECLPCGQGMQTRTALCIANDDHIAPDTTGAKCIAREGAVTLSQTCTSDATCEGKMAAWAFGPWGTCSKTCGTGFRSRAVWCPTPAYGCKGTKWGVNMRCNTNGCPGYGWKIGAWGECSSPCSNVVGVRTRTVACMGTDGSLVRDAICRLNSTAPNRNGHCYSTKTCASLGFDWVSSDWSVCSTANTCGVGIRTRTVACSGPTEEYCSCATKPESAASCETECDDTSDAVWTQSAWSECTETVCGAVGVKIAPVSCLTSEGLEAYTSVCSAKESLTDFLAAHPSVATCTASCN